MKIVGKDEFQSIRTNNAVVSNKFCYEVQIVTNGLMQIGWVYLV